MKLEDLRDVSLIATASEEPTLNGEWLPGNISYLVTGDFPYVVIPSPQVGAEVSFLETVVGKVIQVDGPREPKKTTAPRITVFLIPTARFSPYELSINPETGKFVIMHECPASQTSIA